LRRDRCSETRGVKTVMLIRHAEKPRPEAGVQGVDELGRVGPQNLSVKGWQRAGALVCMFRDADADADADAGAGPAGIVRPRHLFAPRVTALSPSARGAQTLAPLAQALGVAVNTDHEKDDIAGLMAAIGRCPQPVLVAWQHKAIVRLANALLGSSSRSPQRWPDDCFDMVWSFAVEPAEVRFQEIPQSLLGGDRRAALQPAPPKPEFSKEPT
jgi:hypothetical protein